MEPVTPSRASANAFTPRRAAKHNSGVSSVPSSPSQIAVTDAVNAKQLAKDAHYDGPIAAIISAGPAEQCLGMFPSQAREIHDALISTLNQVNDAIIFNLRLTKITDGQIDGQQPFYSTHLTCDGLNAMDWSQFKTVTVHYEQGRALDFSFPYSHTFPGEYRETELYHVNTLVRPRFSYLPVISMFNNGRTVIFDVPPVESVVKYFNGLTRGSPKNDNLLIEVESVRMPSNIDGLELDRYFGSMTKSEVLARAVTKDYCYGFLPAWQADEPTRRAMYHAYKTARMQGRWE
ncbi:uncharacterized protein PAC_11185 [Phialocephala subalpina]|uniref:Uncharacterized protein n=1 Tax=Phialocephala subalpina TaxID=576137 RepID=A0A1L7X8C8_9HELO|nr:uncharacterized protein PAC_11185 [Phialocephala subalpina]